MRRNLDRRIEAVTPIEDIKLKKHLYDLLNTYLKDSYCSWEMNSDGDYTKSKKSDTNHSQFELIEKWH